MYSVSDETRKPIFEGVQGENEAREIQFDVTAWVEELGEGVCTATAKRPTDTTPYPVTVTRSGNVVTWKPNSTDTSIEGIGAFQLAFSINDVVAKTRIWNTKIAPSLVGAGDPPDPYDDWIQDLRDIAAETLTYSQNAENSADDAEAEKLESEAWAKGTKNGTPVPSTADQYENNAKYFAEESYKNAEAWAVGQRGGVDVPSTDPTYENNAKYWAEQSLANQYGAYIVKSASGDIASFSDGADNVPMKSLNVQIVPKQSGSGDPSPSNIRPITGWTDADVNVAGKNLFDGSFVQGSFNNNGTESPSTTRLRSGYIKVKAGSVALSTQDGNVVVHEAYTWDRNGAFVSKVQITGTGTQNGTVTIPNGASYLRFSVRHPDNSTITPTDVTAQVELGSTATDYVPYNGHTTPVPLGQTVYGGTLDVGTGELTITQVAVDAGALSWTTRYTGSTKKTIAASVGASNKYNPQSQLDFVGACGVYIGYVAGSSILNNPDDRATGFYTYRGSNDTPEDSLYMVLPVNDTPSGLVVFNKYTPTTVQLTPAQVASLLGDNNVWADCGAVEVEYRADPTLAYNELQALILENL